MNLWTLVLVVVSALVTFPEQTPTKVATPTQSSDACQKFVQAFYDWYTGSNLGKHNLPNMRAVLERKREVLSTELADALAAEFAAEDKDPGEIGALDFDPFVASQDPCSKYFADKASPQGNGFRVAIYGLCGGKKKARPDLFALAENRDGRWVFTNFVYKFSSSPKESSLLEILKGSREADSKSSK